MFTGLANESPTWAHTKEGDGGQPIGEKGNAMKLTRVILGVSSVVLTSAHEAPALKGRAGQRLSWQYLRTNIRGKDPREITAWQAAYPEAFDGLNCLIIPEKIDGASDMAILEAFGSRLLDREYCMEKVLGVLIRSRISAQTFGKFIFARRDWIPETYWGTVLALLREHLPTKDLPEYYLQVVRCFDFVEAMAPHFRPALDGLVEEPIASIVRFTPLYFILAKVDVYVKRPRDTDTKALKEQDQYSAKLRREFATILEVQPGEAALGYLQAVDFYLGATQYLKRATLNEQEYFNLNLWLRTAFMRDPNVEQVVLDHDLYRLAYLLYLPGIDEATVKRMEERCAVGCLCLYLGRNRPARFEVARKACPAVRRLARIYQELHAPDKTIIPCKRPGRETDLQTVTVPRLGLVRDTKKPPATKEDYLLTHMILMRLFEVSFDYNSLEQFERHGSDQLAFMNATLKDYCSALHMDPTVAMALAAPSAQQSP